MKNTEKKCALLVAYQWVGKGGAGLDAVIMSEVFPNVDAAYAKMDEVMPESMEADDGYDIDQWDTIEDDDIFLQFNAQIDGIHNMLAVLCPVEEGGEL